MDSDNNLHVGLKITYETEEYDYVEHYEDIDPNNFPYKVIKACYVEWGNWPEWVQEGEEIALSDLEKVINSLPKWR